MKKIKYNLPPDAVYADPNIINFTQIPNNLIEDPNLSWKGLGILVFLLKNKNKSGWHTYTSSVIQAKKDKKDSVSSGLTELELLGYVLRFRYFDDKKKIRGSFFAYTAHPFCFELKYITKWIKNKGWGFSPSTINSKQIYEFITKKLKPDFPVLGFPILGNPPLRIKNIKKERKNKKSISLSERKKQNPSFKTSQIISKRLALIVSSQKKINCNSKISSWIKPIELLFSRDLKINGTSNEEIKKRVISALVFYKDHIGEPYIPVIESGQSFREKFLKLENAMIRENQNGYQNNSKKEENSNSLNQYDDHYANTID